MQEQRDFGCPHSEFQFTTEDMLQIRGVIEEDDPVTLLSLLPVIPFDYHPLIDVGGHHLSFIHYAAHMRAVECLRSILKTEGADVNLPTYCSTDDGHPVQAIHISIVNGDVACMDVLLGDESFGFPHHLGLGIQDPLALARDYTSTNAEVMIPFARRLIKTATRHHQDAFVDIAVIGFFTHVCVPGNATTLEFMLKHKEFVQFVNRPDMFLEAHPRNALITAVSSDHDNCVALLLNCPTIDVAAVMPDTGETALLSAIHFKSTKSLKLLLRHKNMQLTYQGRCHHNTAARPAMEMCIFKKFYDSVDVLRELLARPSTDVNARDEHGRTLLMVAVIKFVDVTIVDLLLSHRKCKDNLRDHDGKTALHHACTIVNQTAFDRLLSKGVHLNVKDAHGRTPVRITVAGPYSRNETAFVPQTTARRAMVAKFLAHPQLELNRFIKHELVMDALHMDLALNEATITIDMLNMWSLDVNLPLANHILLQVACDKTEQHPSKVVDALLDAGASATHSSKKRRSVMHNAIRSGDGTLVRQFIRHIQKTDEPQCDRVLARALTKALSERKSDMVRIFVEVAPETLPLIVADGDRSTNDIRWIYDMCTAGVEDGARCIAVLMANGVALRTMFRLFNAQKNDRAITPLMCAAEVGNIKMVHQLLTVPGLDLTLTNVDGKTAEALAANNQVANVLHEARAAQLEHIHRSSGAYSH